MTKLIPLEEVENLFKKMKMWDNHEIQDYVKWWNEWLRITNSFLDELTTIDPIEEIEKMIEDRVYKRKNFWASDEEIAEEDILLELKSRLYPLTQK